MSESLFGAKTKPSSSRRQASLGSGSFQKLNETAPWPNWRSPSDILPGLSLSNPYVKSHRQRQLAGNAMQSLNLGNVVGLEICFSLSSFLLLFLISLSSLGPKKATNQFSPSASWVLNPLR